MTSFYLESLGCAKNLVDSEAFAAILLRAGLEASETPEEADLVLVNTCSFLVDSLRELDEVLAELAFLKQDGCIEKLVVTGCVMNRGLEEFRGLYPEVDAWIGLKDFAALERWLGLESIGKYPRQPIQSGFHRYLRISDGCSNNCSYCAIPSIRGKMCSVPLEDLVREAEELARIEDSPPLELVLIAQRLDVDEELDRLDTHLDEIQAVFERPEPVGRRLDFLMQELNREANTLSSKSADADTTRAAVELKVLIEQMREQIQNIE